MLGINYVYISVSKYIDEISSVKSATHRCHVNLLPISARYEARKAQNAPVREDAVAMRQRHAEAAKQKRMQVMEDANKNMKAPSSAEEFRRQKLADAEADKQKRLKDMTQLGTEMSKMYNTGSCHDDKCCKATTHTETRIHTTHEYTRILLLLLLMHEVGVTIAVIIVLGLLLLSKLLISPS